MIHVVVGAGKRVLGELGGPRFESRVELFFEDVDKYGRDVGIGVLGHKIRWYVSRKIERRD